jgi:hypothetical protein
MPTIDLKSIGAHVPLPVIDSTGTRLLLPRLQLRCWVRLPNTFMPRDGIIDPGSPFTWLSQDVWKVFRAGVDFEELPFEAGYVAPRGQTAGWNFTFRMVRMLQPIVLFDLSTELERHDVILQLADGNPPASAHSNAPPRVVIGLWGGILENTNLRISTNPASGHVGGALEW